VIQDAAYYIDGVRQCNRQVLAKTITLIESALPAHQETARAVIDNLLPETGRAVRLGITGVPGVGKSTFIESLGMFLIGKGRRVAVLAIDPSSRRSGGSILADKTRMERLAVEPKAFIRPSPSGGTLGGVARKTRETLLLCEAAGFDVIIVETVGVGQNETTVASMVDFFLVLMLAGAGDEIQGIKKGVIELADALAVNKADGDNMERAEQARNQYENALHILSPASKNWSPPVLMCSALEVNGIAEIWDTVLKHRETFIASGELNLKRRDQDREWMWALIDEGLKERFNRNEQVRKHRDGLVQDVIRGAKSPTAAAFELLGMLDEG
jgi:LAO/AO transport system kinase